MHCVFVCTSFTNYPSRRFRRNYYNTMTITRIHAPNFHLFWFSILTSGWAEKVLLMPVSFLLFKSSSIHLAALSFRKELSKSLTGNAKKSFLDIPRTNPHAVPARTVSLVKPTANTSSYSRYGQMQSLQCWQPGRPNWQSWPTLSVSGLDSR